MPEVGYKIMIAECWHNSDGLFSQTVKSLIARMKSCDSALVHLGGWAEVGVRIAVLAGIVGMTARQKDLSGKQKVDISMLCGDFYGPISTWLARQWGLPIGTIVCCCNENNTFWELIRQGSLRTDSVAVSSSIREANVSQPEALEYFIHFCGGEAETLRYLDCCRRGAVYYPSEETLVRMRKGLYVSVVGEQRIQATIHGLYSANRYRMSASTALSYAGLQDYRARTGSGAVCMVCSEKSYERDVFSPEV